MYDQQLSIHLAGERGIGLSDLIVKQLSPDQSATVVRGQKIADYERQLLSRKPVESKLDDVTVESKGKGHGLLEEIDPPEENPFWAGFSKIFENSDVEEAIQRPYSILDQAPAKPLDFVDQQKTEQVQLKTGLESQLHNQDNRRINSAEDFVNRLRPYAEIAAKELGVEANVLLSQAALETGWGKSVIKASDGASSYNLFNIKANKSWKGAQQKVETIEYKDGVARKEMAGFRAYSSYQESFDDYVNFIKTNPRYRTAIKMAGKPERYMHELQQAGYATDPNYAKKVMKIYQSKVVANQVLDTLATTQSSISDNS
jgi:flagellar protein FlgJ